MTSAEKRESLRECIADSREAAEDYRRIGAHVRASEAEAMGKEAERQLARLGADGMQCGRCAAIGTNGTWPAEHSPGCQKRDPDGC